MAVSGPMPEGSPTLSANGAFSRSVTMVSASDDTGFCLQLGHVFIAERVRLVVGLAFVLENQLGDLVVGNFARGTDADEFDPAFRFAHGGSASGLGLLDLVGPFR